ncbi:MAG: TDG/mug DNA glycosylase family protein [Gammaproteobacteria bacterium]|jgi:TDG/mug DNA glycosylase family protein
MSVSPYMRTLRDYINPDTEILAVGINPSPISVQQGYPFAASRNRFWDALNASWFVSSTYTPSIESMVELLAVERIGFTDLVKRPTPGISDLRASDYRLGSSQLADKIRHYSPLIVWFQGKTAYVKFLHYGLGRRDRTVAWGEQPPLYAGIDAFVTPNPSSANAVYSLNDICSWMNRLAAFAGRSAPK